MIVSQPYKEIKNTKLPNFSIAWLFPHQDLNRDPSNRLRRYQIHKYFNSLQDRVRSEAIFCYDKLNVTDLKARLSRFDVIVIFNIGDIDIELCLYLKSLNKVVLFDHCENIFNLARENELMVNVSAITCCSTLLSKLTDNFLLSKYGLNKKIFVIRDPIEDYVQEQKIARKADPNIALIMGMGSNVQYSLPFLEDICARAGYSILLISEQGYTFKHPTRTWSILTWVEDALWSTVALCFHEFEKFPAKGNVKVTMPMSLGLPVIASALDAYKEAIDHGSTGYLISDNKNSDEWVKYLEKLKDFEVRNLMGMKARRLVKSEYSTKKIALDYLTMISSLL